MTRTEIVYMFQGLCAVICKQTEWKQRNFHHSSILVERWNVVYSKESAFQGWKWIHCYHTYMLIILITGPQKLATDPIYHNKT